MLLKRKLSSGIFRTVFDLEEQYLLAQHNECDDEGEEHGAEVPVLEEEGGQCSRNLGEVIGGEDQLDDCEDKKRVKHIVFLSGSYSSCLY